MPIRPENKALYPKDWPAISLRIRFERAGGRCECSGQCGTDHALDCANDKAPRCSSYNGHPNPATGSKVVLTVAHLDHTPENCDDSNLLAMCQRCHNRYDAPTRAAGIKARRRAGNAVSDLFEGKQE